MNYFISRTVLKFDPKDMDKYEASLMQLLQAEFVFDSKAFENFILVMQLTPKEKIGKFGPDRLQVSKKEKTLFLGVNLANEKFHPGDSVVEPEFEYISSRILEVKNENLSRLIKNGLVV